MHFFIEELQAFLPAFLAYPIAIALDCAMVGGATMALLKAEDLTKHPLIEDTIFETLIAIPLVPIFMMCLIPVIPAYMILNFPGSIIGLILFGIGHGIETILERKREAHPAELEY